MRCCCKVPFIHSKREFDVCWSYSNFGDGRSAVRFPIDGLYQVMLSSNGVSPLVAGEMVEGTAFLLLNAKANTYAEFELGEISRFVYSDGSLNWKLETSDIEGANLAAGIVIKYVGRTPFTRKPVIVPMSVAKQTQNSRQWWAYRFSDGLDPYSIHNTVVAPGSNWSNYPNNTEHWYIIDVNLPTTQEYTVRVFGDDVGQLIENGIPTIWANLNRNMAPGTPKSTGGWYRKQFEAGVYQFIIYNRQTGGFVDFSAFSIKDAAGNEYVKTEDARLIDRPLNCNNDPLIPIIGKPVDVPPDYDTIGPPGGRFSLLDKIFENPVTPNPVNPIIPKVDDLISEPGGKPPAPNNPPPLPAYRDDGLANNP